MHLHNYWHYYVTETGRVWDNPLYPIPEHFADGYACSCGASPSGEAP